MRVAQGTAIDEAQLLDPIEVGADASLDRDPVIGPGDRDDKVLAAVALRHQHIGGRDAGAELDRVLTVIPVADDVLTVTPVEYIGVVAATAAEPVIARPADQGIVAITGIQHRIVAGAARQGVGKVVPGERVVAPAALNQAGATGGKSLVGDNREGCAAEIDAGQARGRDAGQTQQQPRIGKALRALLCEINQRIGAVSACQQRSGQPVGNGDVQDIADIAALEIGDDIDAFAPARERHEDIISVAFRRAGEFPREQTRADILDSPDRRRIESRTLAGSDRNDLDPLIVGGSPGRGAEAVPDVGIAAEKAADDVIGLGADQRSIDLVGEGLGHRVPGYDDVVPGRVFKLVEVVPRVEIVVVGLAVDDELAEIGRLPRGIENNPERARNQRAHPAAAGACEFAGAVVLKREGEAVGAATVRAEEHLRRPDDVLREVDAAPDRADPETGVRCQLIDAVAQLGRRTHGGEAADRLLDAFIAYKADGRGCRRPAATGSRIGTCEDRIGERIGRGAGGMQHALGRFRREGVRQQRRGAPLRAVAETHDVDRRCTRARLADNRQPVVAADKTQHNVVSIDDDDDVGRRNAAGQAQRIVGACPGCRFADRIAAIAASEDVGGVADASGEHIVACAAVEGGGDVDLRTEIDRVGASPGRGGRVRIDIGELPDRAIGEFELLDAVVDLSGACPEHILQRETVVASRNADHKVVRADREDADVARKDAGGEAHLVDLRRIRDLDVGDRVLPVAAPEEIGVGAAAALHQIVALACGDDVGPAAALDMIVAEAAEDLGADAGIGDIGGHDDVVIAIGRPERGGKRAVVEAAAVRKEDLGYDGIDIACRVDQRDAVVGAADRQHDVAIAVTARDDVFQHDARGEDAASPCRRSSRCSRSDPARRRVGTGRCRRRRRRR